VVGLEVITPHNADEMDMFYNMTNIFEKIIST
jgi:hypothetical protein